VTNHCEVDELLAHIDELLAHIGVEIGQAAMLDFEVERAVATAEKISIAARIDPETVQSLSFGAMAQTQPLLTAEVAFQSCPDCSRHGIAAQALSPHMGIRLPDLWQRAAFNPHQA